MSEGLSVLIAEDDDGHATLIRRSLKRAGMDAATIHLRDGQELLDYVYRKASWRTRELHESMAIIADLNMPRLGGLEILRQLKRDQTFARIPIFVMTTTDNQADVERCYELGAAAYLVKPLEHGMFAEKMRHLAEFLKNVRLPGEGSGMTERHGD
jgi:CheY-like chemotaxis protein